MIRLIYEIKEEKCEDLDSIKASQLNVDLSAELHNATEGEIRGMKFIKESTGLNKINIVNQCKNTMNRQQVNHVDKLIKSILGM